jgi:hypothetical protein
MSLILFSECLRGWLDYPGHLVLFSRPLVASLEFSGGSISPILLWTPDWHFFSRPLVASPEFSDGPVSFDFSFRHLFGISFQVLLWRRLDSWAVLPRLILLLDTRLAFLLFSSGLSGSSVSPDFPSTLLF